MKTYIKSAIVNLSDEPFEVKLSIAKDINTDPEILRQLSEDSNERVVRAVLRNPSTPADILEKYSHSTQILSLEALSDNPALPVSIIGELAKYDTFEICARLICNSNTPEDILDKLVFGHPNNVYLLQLAAKHPNASLRLKETYANHLSEIAHTKEQISDYIKEIISNAVSDAMDSLDDSVFAVNELAQRFPNYDTEWCTGDISESAADAYNTAIDNLVRYEILTLFEGAPSSEE